jgi:hypothetical protein
MKIGTKQKASPEQRALQQEESALAAEQRQQLQRENQRASEEETRLGERAAREERLRQSGRSGRSSLFSGDFAGFRRGGDLGGA